MKLIGLVAGLMIYIAVAFFGNMLIIQAYVPGRLSNKLKELVEDGKWLS